MAAVTTMGVDDRPTGKYAAAMTAGVAWPQVSSATLAGYLAAANARVIRTEATVATSRSNRWEIYDTFGGDLFEPIRDFADRTVRQAIDTADYSEDWRKWVQQAVDTVDDVKMEIRDRVDRAHEDIRGIENNTNRPAWLRACDIIARINEVHAENVRTVAQGAGRIPAVPVIEPSPTLPPAATAPRVQPAEHSVQPASFGSHPESPAPQAPGPASGADVGSQSDSKGDGAGKKDSKKGADQGSEGKSGEKADGNNASKGDAGTDIGSDDKSSPDHRATTDGTSEPAPAEVGHDMGTPNTTTSPSSPMPGGIGSPSMPSSPLGGGGAPKPPSLPSLPSSPLGSPGGATPVSPAAFDKPLSAASGSLLNNTPGAGAFVPPPAAPSGGAGPVAPMTPPPSATPVVPPAAATAAPAPAAATPVTAQPVSHVPAGGMGGMGGMMPPLMSSPAGGGPAPAPMSAAAPPPPVSAPASPAGVGASSVVPAAMSRAEVVRRSIAQATGDSRGRVASEARTLCAALHAATRRWPELLWCVGGRADGMLVVANNIGLGWLPASVRLPRPDSAMLASSHVFAHGDIPAAVRMSWIGQPVRAVQAWAVATGDPLILLAGFEQAIGINDVSRVEVHTVSPDDLPAQESMIGGLERLEVVDPELAGEVEGKTVAALASLLPSAAEQVTADPARASDLWLNVTLSLSPELDTAVRVAAWKAFCEAQLAGAEVAVRAASDAQDARDRYSDYGYWQWNLDQLKVPASA
ncbi:hypothetical protein GCM10009632_05080 [Mycolicibacterium alvei]|uniref:DUF5632 domain-containing protein n=2 Tax=Mycolicibacterium alvei TaxID=67081 RepID=A0A6N4V3T5_9MYCO|nr:hypothetical protein MALV_56720 [Mycolicibacterium alvei]